MSLGIAPCSRRRHAHTSGGAAPPWPGTFVRTVQRVSPSPRYLILRVRVRARVRGRGRGRGKGRGRSRGRGRLRVRVRAKARARVRLSGVRRTELEMARVQGVGERAVRRGAVDAINSGHATHGQQRRRAAGKTWVRLELG